MDIGLLCETAAGERRVALTPVAVRRLSQAGNRVFVEHAAGEASHFSDSSYSAAGARIVFAPAEAIDRSELLIKVERPTADETERLHSGQTVMAFFNLATVPRTSVQRLLSKSVTAIANELIEAGDGCLPVLQAMSEIAGQLAIYIAAHLLRSTSDGRGVLLGGAPGIAPARVVILGAGTVGQWAAKTAVSIGASTLVLDRNVSRLRRLLETAPGVVTAISDAEAIARSVPHADVLVGAVRLPGERTPHLVTKATVESMRRGTVILDISIDQGGCVETSRPTTLYDPVFNHKGVLHYCVPNMTADLAHSASVALSQSVLPYIEVIASHGVRRAVTQMPGLARGVCTFGGHPTNTALAERWQMTARSVHDVLSQPEEGQA